MADRDLGLRAGGTRRDQYSASDAVLKRDFIVIGAFLLWFVEA